MRKPDRHPSAGVYGRARDSTGSDSIETRIRALADSIYRRADWNFMRNLHPAILMGWKPVTNFNGFVGLAYISGMVTETNTTTGAKRKLPFLTSDMRFMQGVFRDTEGRVHQGAFALV